MRKKKTKGKGFIEDADKFLKNTKLLSKVGQAVLPFALGALGTTLSPLGSAAGAAIGQAGVEGLKNYGYGQKERVSLSNPIKGRGGGYQGSEYQNMTTALYSNKPSNIGVKKAVGTAMVTPKTGIFGGAIYSQGMIPIHKNTGAGSSSGRDYKTRTVMVRKPIIGGGMSVYNDVVSQFGNPKF
jgi:hypothetical protein